MTAFMDALIAELQESEDARAQLAQCLAPMLAEQMRPARASGPEWLNTTGAAEYLACPRSRIYDLVQLGHLKPRRDGRRLAFRRSDLAAYLERG